MRFSLRGLLRLSMSLVLGAVFTSCGAQPRPADVQQIPFASMAWKRGDSIQNHRTVRSQMVDELIGSGRLDGKSREEVEELLGPSLTDMAAAGVDGDRWNMAYHLGLERAGDWSLDEEFLVICFNADNRVVEYRIVPN